MKKITSNVLAFSLCASVMMTGAMASSSATTSPDQIYHGETSESYVNVTNYVWGAVTAHEKGFKITTADGTDMILLADSETYIVDAVSGKLMAKSDIREGESVYAFISDSVMMSEPAQVFTNVIVANIPMDFAVPMYYEVVSSDSNDEGYVFTMRNGDVIKADSDVTAFNYIETSGVNLDEIDFGARMLVWKDMEDKTSQIMTFVGDAPELITTKSGAIMLNGEELSVKAKMFDGTVLHPLRAVGEAMGYTATWSAENGPALEKDGKTVFEMQPNGTLCVIEDGITYVLLGEFSEEIGINSVFVDNM